MYTGPSHSNWAGTMSVAPASGQTHASGTIPLVNGGVPKQMPEPEPAATSNEPPMPSPYVGDVMWEYISQSDQPGNWVAHRIWKAEGETFWASEAKKITKSSDATPAQSEVQSHSIAQVS
jgi:hypothetical protein